MIRSIEIRNFKAFRNLELEFRALTVLTGLNSAGKSTVVQALLLSELATTSGSLVPLNGPFGLSLGEAEDVLNAQAPDRRITFVVTGDEGVQETVLDVPDGRSLGLLQRRRRGSRVTAVQIGSYLSAERLGPRDVVDVSQARTEEPVVGERGQYTAYVLAAGDRQIVSDAMLHPSTETSDIGRTLSLQAEAWLSSIVRPIRLDANWIPTTGAASLRFRDPELAAEWSRPANVGFGFSYCLPVIVAGLSTASGMLIVENPEAHLHPASQAALGSFLARVAGAGVQVTVETHSEHVVNGMRIAIGGEKLLSESDAIFHFFTGSGSHEEIEVTSSGAMSNWPRGFFDQTELDLATLNRLRRNARL